MKRLNYGNAALGRTSSYRETRFSIHPIPWYSPADMTQRIPMLMTTRSSWKRCDYILK